MKKRVLIFILAICMILPMTFALTACGGGGLKRSEANFAKVLDEPNFRVYSRNDIQLYMYANSYQDRDTEYVKETVNGETKYFAYDIFSKELTEVTQNEYKYSRETFAPIINFVKSKYSEFTKFEDMRETYIYTGDVDAATKTKIEEIIGEEYVHQSIIYRWEGASSGGSNGGVTCIWFVDDKTTVTKYDKLNLDVDNPALCFYGFLKDEPYDYSYYSAYKAEQNLFVDTFKVIGGEGADYMEFYFTENSMRFYTPNVTSSSGNEEAIFNVKDGVYTYYTRQKGSTSWSSQVLTKEDYENRINTIYDMYIGVIFDDFTGTNKWYKDKNSDTYKKESIDGGNLAIYKVTHQDIRIKADENMKIKSANWKVNYTSSIGNVSLTYDYKLTVGGVTIDVPNA